MSLQPSRGSDPTLRELEDAVTTAELRALQAYLEAGSIKAAAQRLHCAESTIKNHHANVRAKLGVRTTAAAVFKLHNRLAA